MTPSQPSPRDSKRRNHPNKSDKRACPRFPSHVKTFCQSIKKEDELLWSVQVEELSCQGLKIVCHRRFEPGTVLRVGLIHEKAGLLMARAVRVSPTPEGDWVIGCTFPKNLKEDEMRAWLEQGR
jgi:hypothetical protein